MRVALVSPYSYTYPGGVGRHVEALAEGFWGRGHDVRPTNPFDPDDRLARVLHRGARPQRRPLPDYPDPTQQDARRAHERGGLNRTTAPTRFRCSAANSAEAAMTWCTSTSNAPIASWYAAENAPVSAVRDLPAPTPRAACPTGWPRTSAVARRICAKLAARIAVSEAAAWTARRFYGGRYEIVPNGVDLAAARPGRADARRAEPPLHRARRGTPRACRSCCARSRRCAAGVESAADRGRRRAPMTESSRCCWTPRAWKSPGRCRGREVGAARQGRPAEWRLARRRASGWC